MPTDFVRDVTHLRIIIFCKLYFFSYTGSFSHIIKISDGRSQLFVVLCMFLGEDNSLLDVIIIGINENQEIK